VVDNRLTGSNTTTYTYNNGSNVAKVKNSNVLNSTFTCETLNRLIEMKIPLFIEKTLAW
jgi:hypothetical protein